MEEIVSVVSSGTHEVVLDDENHYILAENQVLIRNKQSDELFYIQLDGSFKEIFGDVLYKEITHYYTTTSRLSTLGSTTPTAAPSHQKWLRSQILKLISLYEKHQKDFLSTTIKNEKVWKLTSIEMECFTAKQCSDKFKYLKQKYIKKKDNMGPGSSGAEYYNFEYFEQFNQIFGKKPNITPVSVASSMRGDKGSTAEENSHSDEDTGTISSDNNMIRVPSNISKKNNIDKLIGYLKEKNDQVEQNRERRHQERLAAFNEKMDLLLDHMKRS